MIRVRRLIVTALNRACDLTHDHHRWGCILATWSDRLDQRWQTGVWLSEGPRIRENLQRSRWWWQ
jgi:hypothetical protein